MMTIKAGDQLSYKAGPKGEIPNVNLTEFVFSNPFQNSPNTFTSLSSPKINPTHSFQNQQIPPQKPIFYNSGTGSSITWERLKSDSLRIARSINTLVGKELPFDGKDDNIPIHSTRTTILVCLPNCLAFAPIVLGSWAALCTITTVSSLLMPDELAHILAKSRPQILFVSSGKDGEGRMWEAVQKVLKGDVMNLKNEKVIQKSQKWAKELTSVWQSQRSKQFQRGELSPNTHKRIFTVNIGSTYGGPADYYGTSARKDGVSILSNPNDWSHLLAPPQGHRQGESLDNLERPAFTIRKLTKAEQKRRTALILWSSGTTGPSKGVLLSHFATVSSVYSLWNGLPSLQGTCFGGGETWVALAPWTHMYGLMVILLPAVAIGATIILPGSPRFDLKEYLQTVQKYKVTHLHVSPPVVVHLRNLILEQKRQGKINKKALESVRAICCGGAPTSYAAIQTIFDNLEKPVHQAYGSTETGSTSHAIVTDYSFTNELGQMEIGSVGAPLPNVELSIRAIEGCLNPNDIERRTNDVIKQVESSGLEGKKRKHCLNGKIPGEIWIRANGNMQGYYSGLGSDEDIEGALDKEITSNTITKDGWIKTGDEGILDNQGQLWIVGRIKELIKVKGFQVAPVELDGIFGKHEEVNDAATVGIVEKDGNEEICMYIVPNQENILKDIKEQEQLVKRLTDYIIQITAYYKWPKYFVICQQLIKNPTGKILRKDLHTIPGKRHLAPRPSSSSNNKKTVLDREARL